MATIRQGYLDDFTIKNSKVGIGTSDPTEALEVIGGSRSQDIKVAGIATLTSYEGFQNRNTSYTENVNIAGGESGTLSGEIVVGSGLSMTVGTGATSGQGNIECMKVYDTFTPPCGGTANRPAAAKPGTIYYNKDFRTIEYWDGNFWRQVDNVTRMGRGVMGGRYSAPTSHSTIGYITIATRGNEQDFGELTEITQYPANGNLSSSIRGLIMGGSGPAYKDVISYITIASKGNAIDFGNLTDARHYGGGMSSSTRAIVAGGYDGSADVNVIDYVEISTIGNAVDFGDTDVARRNGPGCASPTRGVFGGGLAPGATSDIQFLTIASKGNSIRFGELTMAVQGLSCGSNSVRGLFNGCSAPLTNTIQYITIASTGNAMDFGDMTTGKRYGATPTSSTRAVFAGGGDPTGSVIDSVEIATAANAVDFGDMMDSLTGCGSISDSHGGLGGF